MKNAFSRLSRVAALVLVFCGVGVASAANFTIQMTNFKFTPDVQTVTVGDTVTWTNLSAGNHTSTSADTNLCSPNPFWHSGNRGLNGTFTLNTTGLAPGTYTYTCTNHCTVQHMDGTLIISAPNTPPTVSVTNPIANAKFVAPASVTIGANAADPGGSVTNVKFLIGSATVGNDTTAPYSAVTNGLPAGNYALSAIASDNNGATATSSVVNIFVLTNATLTLPLAQPDGTFQFTVLGIAGQTYATEASTNFTNWTAILTNLAPADVFSVTDGTSSNLLQRFYRTRQDLF